MNWNEFKNNVEQWAAKRGIYEHSTPEAQLLKALSELGELADAVIKNDREALKDAIGDVAVCAINYAKLAGLPSCGAPVDYIKGGSSISRIGEICVIIGRILRGGVVHDSARCLLDVVVGICRREGLDFIDCCEAAWNEIKDRKGRMVPGGAFVKEPEQ